MSSLHLDYVNFIAVVAGGVGAFFLGALWYTALFGPLWRRLGGYTEERIKELQARTSPAIFFGGMLLAYLLISFGVALLVTALNLTTAGDGAMLGLILWLIVAAIGLTGHLAGERPIGMYAIDVGFQLVYLVGLGALLTAWRYLNG